MPFAAPPLFPHLTLRPPHATWRSGHWVLSFPDADRAASAQQLVEEWAHKMRAAYCQLLQPLLHSDTSEAYGGGGGGVEAAAGPPPSEDEGDAAAM